MTDISAVTGKTRLLNVISLFTSASTLVCCALPALLVAIGAGAALSGLVSTVPQLVWISEHKTPIFAFAGAMLLLAGLLQWNARSAPCPADPALADACRRTRRNSLRIYWSSLALFAIGAWFAFIAPLLI
ncbi:MAG TPA: hypothetical protein VEA39_02140 [Methylophilaceae bacterium]|nr:hypothetical protein [Methylophilaceae bacterium]